MMPAAVAPTITNDPRFRGGRALIESGKVEEAVAMFATILEVCFVVLHKRDELENFNNFFVSK